MDGWSFFLSVVASVTASLIFGFMSAALAWIFWQRSFDTDKFRFLNGSWHSAWKPNEGEQPDRAISECIEITPFYVKKEVSLFGFRREYQSFRREVHFSTTFNSLDYDWRGVGYLTDRWTLHGYWEEKNGPESGTFTLKMQQGSNSMVGAITGSLRNGGFDTSNWILARRVDDLKRVAAEIQGFVI
ncbi:hypothetical protein H9N28_16475 [Rhodobacter capsulatus]|uniref:hypothetical protein n=1 Tax=Rhodobacter capsulatus TaxID=1061 RepID=UPI0011BD07D6|nr:hypothetical protein [Rhodobacter capsulatus]QNR63113.1 hypothetical protein H9N28_16475 [Rhodobacter capsulatus]